MTGLFFRVAEDENELKKHVPNSPTKQEHFLLGIAVKFSSSIFSSAAILLCTNMLTRHGLLPGLHDMLATHICTLLCVAASATSASGYVQQDFKKSSSNQCDLLEQGICAGKAGHRPPGDALLYCSLSRVLPALPLLQRAELC